MSHGKHAPKGGKEQKNDCKTPRFPLLHPFYPNWCFSSTSQNRLNESKWQRRHHIHKIGKSIYMPLLPEVSVPSWTGVSPGNDPSSTKWMMNIWWYAMHSICSKIADVRFFKSRWRKYRLPVLEMDAQLVVAFLFLRFCNNALLNFLFYTLHRGECCFDPNIYEWIMKKLLNLLGS